MNNNYFAEDNAVKFDLQNGKIETLAFARDKNMAEEIARGLNLLDEETKVGIIMIMEKVSETLKKGEKR